jgi:penicillin-binding protein 1C
MSAATRRQCIVALAALPLAAAVLIALVLLWPKAVPTFAAVRAAYTPSEAWLTDRNGVPLDTRRTRYDVRRLPWVPLEQVSPALVRAIVQGEDQRFWQHRGIDWRSALGAARDEFLRHRRRGASLG